MGEIQIETMQSGLTQRAILPSIKFAENCWADLVIESVWERQYRCLFRFIFCEQASNRGGIGIRFGIERCAAFMPLKCNFRDGIRINPMLLDLSTLRRNKFRDPRIMGVRCIESRIEAVHGSANLMTLGGVRIQGHQPFNLFRLVPLRLRCSQSIAVSRLILKPDKTHDRA